MTEPITPYLRRREVRGWLDQYSPRLFGEFEKLVDSGTIKRIRLSPKARGYYVREEIDEKILKPFRCLEQPLNPVSLAATAKQTTTTTSIAQP